MVGAQEGRPHEKSIREKRLERSDERADKVGPKTDTNGAPK